MPDRRVVDERKQQAPIFLSYARGDDDAFVRRLFEDLTSKGFDVWWDQRQMPSRRRTFLQELRDAISQRPRMLAIITPRALDSDYVEYEWKTATLFCQVLIPILRIGSTTFRRTSLRMTIGCRPSTLPVITVSISERRVRTMRHLPSSFVFSPTPYQRSHR